MTGVKISEASSYLWFLQKC